MPDLQVLICTYGQAGLNRIAENLHPSVPGVEYLVGLQGPVGTEFEVPQALQRSDFKIFPHNSKGLSRNRNFILSKATAPLVLISDDDLSYTSHNLLAIIEAFRSNPQTDILAFDHTTKGKPKKAYNHEFDLAHPAKGYFLTSFELALRRDKLPPDIQFNEYFGVNATFPAGEEEIFLHDLLSAGMKGMFIPLPIAEHPDQSTGERLSTDPEFISGKGAVFLRLFPKSWPLRMLRESVRHRSEVAPISYISSWLKGVRKARTLKVFRAGR